MAARMSLPFRKMFLSRIKPLVLLRSQSSFASYESSIANLPDTLVTTLSNGLRVASLQTGGASATVGFWADAGARYEKDENHGAAHFFEHLFYKGTEKRSQAKLEQEVENIGASINSYTSREQTAFYARCFGKDVEKMVELLTDMTFNSAITAEDVEKTKTAVMDELKETGKDYRQVSLDYLHGMAYQGTPLSRTVMGSTQSVRSLQRDDIINYGRKLLIPPRMILICIGDVDHAKLVQYAEKNFASVKVAAPDGIIPKLPCRFTSGEVTDRDDAIPFAHIAFAVERPGWEGGEGPALMVANSIVGSFDRTHGAEKMSASLLAETCAMHNCAVAFESFNICYSSTGLWGIYMVCDRMSIDDMFGFVQEEWMRICNSATDFEVQRAKNQLRMSLLQMREDPVNLCNEVAVQLFNLDRIVPFSEIDARIQSLSGPAVTDVANKYIYDRDPVFAAVGPTEQVPDHYTIKSQMYWFRT